MNGEFPPASKDTLKLLQDVCNIANEHLAYFFIVLEDSAYRCFATAVEPVNVTFLTALLVHNSFPTFDLRVH